MKRIFGLVGYACNGKSTIIKEIINNKKYKFIDLPQIYKNEAELNGYDGVTEWYTNVDLKEYVKKSRKAVLDYIKKELPRNENLIIDDIFDIEIYKSLIDIFPQMKLISFHSKYNDRLNRLQKRANIVKLEDLVKGLEIRDTMKKNCGIEEIFPHCKYEINNNKGLNSAKKLFNTEIKKNLIVCIVGYSGSGKSTISTYVGQSLNIPVFQYGKEVKKIINKAGYARSRNYIFENGTDKYISLTTPGMLQCIKKFTSKNSFFIIDGIVSINVFEKLKSTNEVFTIYIKLDKDERIKRIQKRENIDLENAILELNTKDNIKIENGLDIIVSKCNVVINNNKTMEVSVKEIIKEIEKVNH